MEEKDEITARTKSAIRGRSRGVLTHWNFVSKMIRIRKAVSMIRVRKWATDIDHTWTVPRARGVKISRVIRDVSMMRFVVLGMSIFILAADPREICFAPVK